MVADVRHVVPDDGVAELVVRLRVHHSADAVGLGAAVPSEEVGARVPRVRRAVVGLAVDVVQARVPVRRLVLLVVDALPVRALEDAERARVAYVAVHLPLARVALDARGTALAVEADGGAGALLVLLAVLSVRLELGLVVGRVDAEPAAAEAHHLDEPRLVPRPPISRLGVHALVVAGEAGVLEAGAALQQAARLAPRLDVRGAVLVVRHLVQREAALVVGGVLAIRVGASRRDGAFAGGVDQRVAVEHVERLALDRARHLEPSSHRGGALLVLDVRVPVRLHRGPELGAGGLVADPSPEEEGRKESGKRVLA